MEGEDKIRKRGNNRESPIIMEDRLIVIVGHGPISLGAKLGSAPSSPSVIEPGFK